jgi:hypothetical protein
LNYRKKAVVMYRYSEYVVCVYTHESTPNT